MNTQPITKLNNRAGKSYTLHKAHRRQRAAAAAAATAAVRLQQTRSVLTSAIKHALWILGASGGQTVPTLCDLGGVNELCSGRSR